MPRCVQYDSHYGHGRNFDSKTGSVQIVGERAAWGGGAIQRFPKSGSNSHSLCQKLIVSLIYHNQTVLPALIVVPQCSDCKV